MAGDGVGRATVYRTIDLLSETGLLVRVHTAHPEACCTASGVGHSQPLVCRESRRVVELDGEGGLSLLERHLKRRPATGSAAIIWRSTACAGVRGHERTRGSTILGLTFTARRQ